MSGSGAAEIERNGSTSSYQFTLAGTIVSLNNAELVFDYPALMPCGTVIKFKTGTPPTVDPDLSDIAGHYEGYTLATNGAGYFTDMLTEDENMLVTVNTDGATLDLALTSSALGTFSAEGVTAELTSDGVYEVSASGSAEMERNGNSSSYSFTLTGTITSTEDAELAFDFPGLMSGGTVITFYTGTYSAE